MSADPTWRVLSPTEHAYYVRSLETGAEAVMVAEPYRLTSREKWSFRLDRVVQIRYRKTTNKGSFSRPDLVQSGAIEGPRRPRQGGPEA